MKKFLNISSIIIKTNQWCMCRNVFFETGILIKPKGPLSPVFLPERKYEIT